MIYLDYNATTPVDERAFDAMTPWMSGKFWNASSSHRPGRIAADAVERSRAAVADLLGASPNEVVWTSGATEANNLALKGLVERARPGRSRVVTTATEHKAVLDTVEWLAGRGTPATVLGVDRDGRIRLDELAEELERGDVAVVSIMAANNETGVCADLKATAELVHEHGGLLHTDATQAVGKIPFRVDELGVDLASLSGHKMYGPKGLGALVVRRGVDLAPTIHGGGHERTLRSGTLNVPAIVGLGVAAEVAREVLDADCGRMSDCADLFLTSLGASLPGTSRTAPREGALPNTLNIRIAGVDADALVANVPEVAFATGSACTSYVPTPSHVLLAMGFTPEEAAECIRISFGRPTTNDEVLLAADAIARGASRIRELA